MCAYRFEMRRWDLRNRFVNRAESSCSRENIPITELTSVSHWFDWCGWRDYQAQLPCCIFGFSSMLVDDWHYCSYWLMLEKIRTIIFKETLKLNFEVLKNVLKVPKNTGWNAAKIMWFKFAGLFVPELHIRRRWRVHFQHLTIFFYSLNLRPIYLMCFVQPTKLNCGTIKQ